MIDAIERALRALEEMIRIVERRDYEQFLDHVSPRIRDRVDTASFQKAIDRHERTPLSVEMIDKDLSRVVSENPLMVKLMIQEGWSLTTFIYNGEKWVADTIFW